MSCKTCESKDAEISFLREMVKDFMKPYIPAHQVFKPSYVNDRGDMVELTEETEMVDVGGLVKDEYGEETKVVQEINIVNEIIGH